LDTLSQGLSDEVAAYFLAGVTFGQRIWQAGQGRISIPLSQIENQ
jgi:hypothetical protein